MATVMAQASSAQPRKFEGEPDREQRTYTLKVGVNLALYASLFFVVAFCGPYVLPAVTLLTDSPLADRQMAASQLLLLHNTVWVALPVLFLGALLFSLLATRRVMDAMERLGRSAQAWAGGAHAHRIHFRQSDHLDGLAQQLNQGWERVGEAFTQIDQETIRAQAAVEGAVKVVSPQVTGGADVSSQLQTALDSLKRLQQVLGRFHVVSNTKPKL